MAFYLKFKAGNDLQVYHRQTEVKISILYEVNIYAQLNHFVFLKNTFG